MIKSPVGWVIQGMTTNYPMKYKDYVISHYKAPVIFTKQDDSWFMSAKVAQMTIERIHGSWVYGFFCKTCFVEKQGHGPLPWI